MCARTLSPIEVNLQDYRTRRLLEREARVVVARAPRLRAARRQHAIGPLTCSHAAMRKHYRRFRTTLNALAAFAIGTTIAKSKFILESVNHPHVKMY